MRQRLLVLAAPDAPELAEHAVVVGVPVHSPAPPRASTVEGPRDAALLAERNAVRLAELLELLLRKLLLDTTRVPIWVAVP